MSAGTFRLKCNDKEICLPINEVMGQWRVPLTPDQTVILKKETDGCFKVKVEVELRKEIFSRGWQKQWLIKGYTILEAIEEDQEEDDYLIFDVQQELRRSREAIDFHARASPDTQIFFKLWRSGAVGLFLRDDFFELQDSDDTLNYFELVAEPTFQEIISEHQTSKKARTTPDSKNKQVENRKKSGASDN